MRLVEGNGGESGIPRRTVPVLPFILVKSVLINPIGPLATLQPILISQTQQILVGNRTAISQKPLLVAHGPNNYQGN